MVKFISIAALILTTSFGFAQDISSDYLSKRWKDVATNMPPEWYGSDEAKQVAENVLLSQKEIGGWEKNKAYHKRFSKTERAHYINDKSEVGATFDNDATILELRFLAKIYSQVKDERYKQAFEKGLNYILIAQYENGGWPQFFPVRKGSVAYSGHITYNDNAMVNIMKMVKEIISNSEEYASLQISSNTRARAKEAFDKGIQCFLDTQIIYNGQPTVWCAQHDSLTLAPAKARSYELPSFSGSESVGIVSLLMDIENPSPAIITSINGAIQWFENNKIEGIRIETEIKKGGKKNRIVVEDPDAPALWGRFYDLETCKIYFCSRDGIKKNTLAEISDERRNGYSWYINGPEKVLKKYPEWLAKHKPFNSQSFIQKDRVIILTDIEADPDDTQSLIRLLLYSNGIDIKGLIATTSCWLTTRIHPESIKKVIQAYAQIQPNLIKHDPGFPEAEALMPFIKQGLPKYGMNGVGEGMDSEGSNWIIKELEEKDDRPLWISIWGGANTLAQALYKIKNTRPEKELKRLTAKLRVYTISDQDDSGIWIRNNFPDLFYIVSPGDHYGSATWTGINTYIKGIDNTTISNSWIAENIQQNHGPLGAAYPDVAWGVEGDTPAFLPLIKNGLNESEHPEWGGWGGRYELYLPDFSKTKEGGSIVTIAPETRDIWTNAVDSYSPYLPREYGRTVKRDTISFNDSKVTLWRWRDDFQNDFAARMDWCLKSYQESNHPPVPVLSHPEEITVKSGEGFSLDAYNTTDPDGDNFSFLWFNYPEAGTYKKLIKVNGAENVHIAYFTAPEVDKEETAHFILKVTDKGVPQLSRYKRVIVTIKPK